uniref:Uncharacterized protein n=1 Tax=Anguilla anguilla TaxID=7936 RepID=A0A0E9UVI4_ANGAN
MVAVIQCKLQKCQHSNNFGPYSINIHTLTLTYK